MGTAPVNFPPETVIPIGKALVGTLLGLTAALPPTVLFTAPNPGIYTVGLYVRFIASDGAGSIQPTIMPPHSVSIAAGAQAPGIDKDIPLSPRPFWLNAGDTVMMSCTATGLTATTYNAYMTAVRLS